MGRGRIGAACSVYLCAKIYYKMRTRLGPWNCGSGCKIQVGYVVSVMLCFTLSVCTRLRRPASPSALPSLFVVGIALICLPATENERGISRVDATKKDRFEGRLVCSVRLSVRGGSGAEGGGSNAVSGGGSLPVSARRST